MHSTHYLAVYAFFLCSPQDRFKSSFCCRSRFRRRVQNTLHSRTLTQLTMLCTFLLKFMAKCCCMKKRQLCGKRNFWDNQELKFYWIRKPSFSTCCKWQYDWQLWRNWKIRSIMHKLCTLQRSIRFRLLTLLVSKVNNVTRWSSILLTLLRNEKIAEWLAKLKNYNSWWFYIK